MMLGLEGVLCAWQWCLRLAAASQPWRSLAGGCDGCSMPHLILETGSGERGALAAADEPAPQVLRARAGWTGLAGGLRGWELSVDHAWSEQTRPTSAS